MRNLNIKIPGFKPSDNRPNRWIGATLCVLILGFFLYWFSDLSTTLAHVVFANSPVSPIIRWLVVLIVLAICVLGCYAFIDVLRHGPRRKRRQKDEPDAR
jgi:TRAP-type C4-dicarboxylate transport system permease small subunit